MLRALQHAGTAANCQQLLLQQENQQLPRHHWHQQYMSMHANQSQPNINLQAQTQQQAQQQGGTHVLKIYKGNWILPVRFLVSFSQSFRAVKSVLVEIGPASVLCNRWGVGYVWGWGCRGRGGSCQGTPMF